MALPDRHSPDGVAAKGKMVHHEGILSRIRRISGITFRNGGGQMCIQN
jgi:hypothetical protein